ncbi:GCN5-related N-acetyltransferase [Trametes maxima]|nr:GCN5-related N-acetyltransferase [Trametes maxima]
MSIEVAIQQISAEETVPLRHSVLWPNHPVSHVLLPEDASGLHYGAFLPGTSAAVSVISVFRDPLPSPVDSEPSIPAPPAARFRKFACAPEHQGKGVGTQLLRHIFETVVLEMACTVVWCDARTSAAGWYERRGMQRFGEVFLKGDIEYVRMMREL